MTTLIVTAAASEYIRKMVEKDGGVGLRITIKKTGCSGYSYAPVIVKEAIATDTVFQAAENVTLFLDPLWLHLLDGIQIDFQEDEKSGLKQKRLLFINPKESSRCGCGESFHVDEDNKRVP